MKNTLRIFAGLLIFVGLCSATIWLMSRPVMRPFGMAETVASPASSWPSWQLDLGFKTVRLPDGRIGTTKVEIAGIFVGSRPSSEEFWSHNKEISVVVRENAFDLLEKYEIAEATDQLNKILRGYDNRLYMNHMDLTFSPVKEE